MELPHPHSCVLDLDEETVGWMWKFLETSIKSGTSETDMAQRLYSMTAATTLTKVKKTMSAVWISVLEASRPRLQASVSVIGTKKTMASAR